jgi:non-heme chloroperoxidase
MSTAVVELANVVELKILGHHLRYRPLDVRTPDGLRVSAQDWRSGENGRDVLLIHGFSQSHLCWLKQLASPLSQRYRLVTYDLRGHGGSDKPLSREYYQDGARWAGEVQAVIEAAGLVRPVIVAWSYAGRVVLDYLQLVGGDAIAGLVMVAATACADRSLFGPTLSLVGAMAAATDLSRNIEATDRFVGQCVATPLPAAEHELMLAYNLMVPPAVRAALGGRPASYQGVLGSLNVPVLVIHGALDSVNLPAMAHYTAGACPQARELIYGGIGHSPFWEAPQRFNADVTAWLDALPERHTDKTQEDRI